MFTNREGGSTIFLLLPGGDQKFNSVFHPVSTAPPREVKNDNSLRAHFRENSFFTKKQSNVHFKGYLLAAKLQY